MVYFTAHPRDWDQRTLLQQYLEAELVQDIWFVYEMVRISRLKIKMSYPE